MCVCVCVCCAISVFAKTLKGNEIKCNITFILYAKQRKVTCCCQQWRVAHLVRHRDYDYDCGACVVAKVHHRPFWSKYCSYYHHHHHRSLPAVAAYCYCYCYYYCYSCPCSCSCSCSCCSCSLHHYHPLQRLACQLAAYYHFQPLPLLLLLTAMTRLLQSKPHQKLYQTTPRLAITM